MIYLKKEFLETYKLFKLDFYRNLNSKNGSKSLTVSESFCLEVIKGLDNATVRDVANFMQISQPNAAYKISNLEDKGYITKNQSTEDKRIFYLEVTELYDEYSKEKNKFIYELLNELDDTLNEKDKKELERLLGIINAHIPDANEYLE